MQVQVAHRTSNTGPEKKFPISRSSQNTKWAGQRKDTESFKTERPSYIERQA